MTTKIIVESLIQAIVCHRLQPGTKLVEQKLADHFGVSRTLVREALFQLSNHRLVERKPLRGTCVATPSVDEAKRVFAVRRMLETEMVRSLAATVNDEGIKVLHEHTQLEQRAVNRNAISERTMKLRDFHVLLANLTGNHVLAETLQELISRCSLIAMIYQTEHAAQHSSEEHRAIVAALAVKDADCAAQTMREHLDHVEASFTFEQNVPTQDIELALQ